jgi:hypothetical protein
MTTIASPAGLIGFNALNSGFLTVAGVPAHPLVVAVVAVLLPLAAVCSVGLAVHRGFRRRFGSPVLILTALAVAAVPLAQLTGTQLTARLASKNPLVARHIQLGNQLLPYALGFGVAVVVLLVAGKLADRERAAEENTSRTWQRISTLLSVLVVAMAVITTVEVVRIGATGAQAVWEHAGS